MCITVLMMRYVHYVISHLLTFRQSMRILPLTHLLVIYLPSKLRDNVVYLLGRCTPVRYLMSHQKLHPNSSKVVKPSLCLNVL